MTHSYNQPPTHGHFTDRGCAKCREKDAEIERLTELNAIRKIEIEWLRAVVDAAQQLVEQGLSKRTTRDQWNAWHILKDALEGDDG